MATVEAHPVDQSVCECCGRRLAGWAFVTLANGATLDFDRYEARSPAGEVVRLEARFWSVLASLDRYRPRAARREWILRDVWGSEDQLPSSLGVAVAGIRRVLGADAIRTVPAVG